MAQKAETKSQASEQPDAAQSQNQSQNQLQNQSQNQAQVFPMHLDVRIGSINPTGNLRATASVNINGCFAVSGVKVMQGNNGLFIAMPSWKNQNGEYRDICFPITKEFRQQLNQEVLNAYEQAVAQVQTTAENPFLQGAQGTQEPAMSM